MARNSRRRPGTAARRPLLRLESLEGRALLSADLAQTVVPFGPLPGRSASVAVPASVRSVVAAPMTATAQFVGSDTTTGGGWSGSYGSDGYEVLGGATALPAYASVTPADEASWTWAAGTSDPRAPQASAGSSGRVAAAWYTAAFTVDVALSDGQAHNLSVYALDWDGAGRSERVEVIDPASGSVLDSRSASSFGGGEYLTWTVSGHIELRFTATAGPNAVLSALFFGGSSGTTTPPPPANSASFVGSDATTGGSWSGSYGSDGYEVLGGATALPAYASVTPADEASWTWAAGTSDPRAPQASAGSSGRVAAAWYTAAFTVDVALSDGQAHNLSVYALDWDGAGRSERVEVIDPASGSVLDSRSASSFGGGEYLTWTVSGHIELRFTATAGPNAVLSALFFGGSSGTTTPPPPTPVSAPYTPAQVRHAYGFDGLSQDGTGQTIAIVDAFDDPTIASDLAAFDQRFNLPAANLVKATPGGAPPAADSTWAEEISLDVEWAHAIAPGATILLVESATANLFDLLDAVSYAVGQGANQVSMSWGAGEFAGMSQLDSTFDHPGVTFLAAAGDGAGVDYPAASPYVTGVGGTTLTIDASGNRIAETAWSSGGGGVSAQQSQPSYQSGFLAGSSRGVPDVSFDADPNTGYSVVDNGSWLQVGGTSAGAPQWAGLIALANQGRASAGKAPLGAGTTYGTNQVLYSLAGGTGETNPNGDFLDVTSGSNGASAAGAGYDAVTGLGSPVANKLVRDLIAS